jgi:hypothetical protein
MRVESALRHLGDCNVKTKKGLTAVDELKHELGELCQRHGVFDLREVQESLVEHAAMYANCPEVLGGMIQLVLCLDLVCKWVAERDARAKALEARLEYVEARLKECDEGLGMLKDEVRRCGEQAHVLDLSADLSMARRAVGASSAYVHQPTLSSAAVAAPTVDQTPSRMPVDLEDLARSACGGDLSQQHIPPMAFTAAADQADMARLLEAAQSKNVKWQQELEAVQRERSELQSNLAAALAALGVKGLD